MSAAGGSRRRDGSPDAVDAARVKASSEGAADSASASSAADAALEGAQDSVSAASAADAALEGAEDSVSVTSGDDAAGVVRAAVEGDEFALIGLYARATGRVITPEHRAWKFASRGLEVPTSFVGRERGELVFHYGASPRAVLIDGERRIACWDSDAMTDPAHRGRGWLLRGATLADATWRQAELPFSIGSPNALWISRARELGWVELFNVVNLVCPLSLTALLTAKTGARLPGLSVIDRALAAARATARTSTSRFRVVDRALAFARSTLEAGRSQARAHERTAVPSSSGEAGTSQARGHEHTADSSSWGDAGTSTAPGHERTADSSSSGEAGTPQARGHERTADPSSLGDAGTSTAPGHERTADSSSSGEAGTSPAPGHERMARPPTSGEASVKLPRDAKQPGQKPARARSASATAPLAVSELSSADDDLDALWSQCRSDRRVVFIRDRDWVTWRYLSSPMIHYRVFAGRRHGELVAWLAVHVTEPANAAGPSLTILDLVAPDHRDAEQLLATTLDLFRRAGAIKAQALVVPGSTRHALFRRAGFLFRRDVLLLQARPMHRSPAIEDLRALDISGGDFDFT